MKHIMATFILLALTLTGCATSGGGLGTAGIITPPRPNPAAAYPQGQGDVVRIKNQYYEQSQYWNDVLTARQQGWYVGQDGVNRPMTEQEFLERKQQLLDQLELSSIQADTEVLVIQVEREKQRFISEVQRNQVYQARAELQLEREAERNRSQAVQNRQREQQNQFRTIDQGVRTVENTTRSLDRTLKNIQNFGKKYR